MHASSRDLYLETQVNTATPQKLRLMLIEGALRFARQTLQLWQDGDDAAALESMIRAREIIGELLAGVEANGSPLTRQVSGIYLYLLSALTEARQARDEHGLAAAIRVLEEERETWRQVCEQMPDRPTPPAAPHFASREELAPAIVSRSEAFSIDA